MPPGWSCGSVVKARPARSAPAADVLEEKVPDHAHPRNVAQRAVGDEVEHVGGELGTLRRWTDARWIGWGERLASIPPARWLTRHVTRDPALRSDSVSPASSSMVKKTHCWGASSVAKNSNTRQTLG